MSKVSVIIPAFNSARYLPEAIESIVNQTYKNMEIVVVDDGSTDNTKEVLRPYVEQKTISYYHQKNSGPASARNEGLIKATGEYIAFLDADDTIPSNSISERVMMLKKYPEISLVFSDYFIVNELKEEYEEKPSLERNSFLDKIGPVIKLTDGECVILKKKFFYYYLKLSPRPIWTGTVMLRRRCIEEYGLFDTTFIIGEDNEYWMRVIRNNHVGFINKPLATYRHDRSCLSEKVELWAKQDIRLQKQISSRMIEEIKCQLNSLWHIRKIISRDYFNLAYHYLKTNRFVESRKALLCSIKYLNIGTATIKLLLLSSLRLSRKKKDQF